MSSPLLTHSRMQSQKTCPRMHYFLYEVGIRRDRESKPLRLGAAVHLGIDLVAKGYSPDEAILAAVAGYEVLPTWAANNDEAAFEWMIERETVARLLAAYFWYWTGERQQVAQFIHSEQSFDLPLRNPETGGVTTSFRLAGKIDKIIQLADGRLAVMEHKTCSDDLDADSDYWRRLRIDSQISLYMLAARQLGYDVRTVYYDVIRKPRIQPTLIPLLDDEGLKIVLDAEGNRVMTKDGKKPRQSGDASQGHVLQQRRQTPAEFGERLTDDIVARPEFYFARQEIPRLESDLTEFQMELWQQQQQIREAQKHDRWFRNTGACMRPYRCEFLDICHAGYRQGDPVPAGYKIIADVHPELSDDAEETDAS